MFKTDSESSRGSPGSPGPAHSPGGANALSADAEPLLDTAGRGTPRSDSEEVTIIDVANSTTSDAGDSGNQIAVRENEPEISAVPKSQSGPPKARFDPALQLQIRSNLSLLEKSDRPCCDLCSVFWSLFAVSLFVALPCLVATNVAKFYERVENPTENAEALGALPSVVLIIAVLAPLFASVVLSAPLGAYLLVRAERIAGEIRERRGELEGDSEEQGEGESEYEEESDQVPEGGFSETDTETHTDSFDDSELDRGCDKGEAAPESESKSTNTKKPCGQRCCEAISKAISKHFPLPPALSLLLYLLSAAGFLAALILLARGTIGNTNILNTPFLALILLFANSLSLLVSILPAEVRVRRQVYECAFNCDTYADLVKNYAGREEFESRWVNSFEKWFARLFLGVLVVLDLLNCGGRGMWWPDCQCLRTYCGCSCGKRCGKRKKSQDRASGKGGVKEESEGNESELQPGNDEPNSDCERQTENKGGAKLMESESSTDDFRSESDQNPKGSNPDSGFANENEAQLNNDDNDTDLPAPHPSLPPLLSLTRVMNALNFLRLVQLVLLLFLLLCGSRSTRNPMRESYEVAVEFRRNGNGENQIGTTAANSNSKKVTTHVGIVCLQSGESHLEHSLPLVRRLAAREDVLVSCFVAADKREKVEKIPGNVRFVDLRAFAVNDMKNHKESSAVRNALPPGFIRELEDLDPQKGEGPSPTRGGGNFVMSWVYIANYATLLASWILYHSGENCCGASESESDPSYSTNGVTVESNPGLIDVLLYDPWFGFDARLVGKLLNIPTIALMPHYTPQLSIFPFCQQGETDFLNGSRWDPLLTTLTVFFGTRMLWELACRQVDRNLGGMARYYLELNKSKLKLDSGTKGAAASSDFSTFLNPEPPVWAGEVLAPLQYARGSIAEWLNVVCTSDQGMPTVVHQTSAQTIASDECIRGLTEAGGTGLERWRTRKFTAKEEEKFSLYTTKPGEFVSESLSSLFVRDNPSGKRDLLIFNGLGGLDPESSDNFVDESQDWVRKLRAIRVNTPQVITVYVSVGTKVIATEGFYASLFAAFAGKDDEFFVILALGKSDVMCCGSESETQPRLWKSEEEFRSVWSQSNSNQSGSESGSAFASRPPVPPNFLLFPQWAPQKSILSNGFADVFLSHCGQNSISEALASAVPLVATPVLWDQPGNARAVAHLGLGVNLRSCGSTGSGSNGSDPRSKSSDPQDHPDNDRAEREGWDNLRHLGFFGGRDSEFCYSGGKKVFPEPGPGLERLRSAVKTVGQHSTAANPYREKAAELRRVALSENPDHLVRAVVAVGRGEWGGGAIMEVESVSRNH